MRIEKKTSILVASYLCTLLLTSCGGGSGQSDNTSGNIDIAGAVQKGPFIVGSTVTINRLSEQGQNTNSTIITNTTDDLGSFSFSMDEAGLVQISSTGYYRNEITGELSSGTLTLRSVYLTTEETDQFAYVNLLTHIISDRVLSLIRNDSIPFDQAVSQAESEFLLSFSGVIPNSTEGSFTSLTIFGTPSSLGSSYLLSVSSVLYQYAIQQSISNSTNPDAELSLLVNELESDFGNDGVINNSSQLSALREVIPQLNPVQIHVNINSWIGDTSEYSPVNINEYLDSDLDGVFNISDQDDDNDGMDDNVDPNPYVPGFVVSNQEVTSDEDVSIVLDVSSNNPLNSVITLEITQQTSNGTLFGNYPELTYVPNSNYVGVDQFKYVLSQSSITSEEVIVLITVLPVNDAPVISGTPSNEIVANNIYSFIPSVLNVDNDQLLFSIENIPSWASFDGTTGLLSGTPSNNDAGNYANIVISVSDAILAMSLGSFSINVLPNPWSEIPTMPTGRHAPAATSSGSKIYISGGYGGGVLPALEVYDVTTGSWETMAQMQTGRRGHTSHTIDNVVYIIGGENGAEIASVEAYDIATNTWTNKTALSVERSFHSSCLYNGNIYVFGGFTDDGIPNVTHTQSLATVVMYDSITNTWSAKSSMSSNNWGMSCAVLNDKIYVFGGANNETGYDIYDPIVDSWGTGGTLNMPRRYGFAASAINGNIYLLGGQNSSGAIQEVEALDINTNTWSTKSSMSSARSDIGSASIGDFIFIVGGRNNSSNNLNTVEAYNPQLD